RTLTLPSSRQQSYWRHASERRSASNLKAKSRVGEHICALELRLRARYRTEQNFSERIAQPRFGRCSFGLCANIPKLGRQDGGGIQDLGKGPGFPVARAS